MQAPVEGTISSRFQLRATGGPLESIAPVRHKGIVLTAADEHFNLNIGSARIEAAEPIWFSSPPDESAAVKPRFSPCAGGEISSRLGCRQLLYRFVPSRRRTNKLPTPLSQASNSPSDRTSVST